jgi:hypothetical protein
VVLSTDAIQRESRAADRIDRRRAELFRSMTKTEGWKVYMELVEAKIQDFSDQLMQPATSVGSLIASEYIKGAMSGLIMARDIASVTIATAEALQRPQAEDDNDDSE